MSTAHCICIGKALEIFVENLAGVGLRSTQSRPQQLITQTNRRSRHFGVVRQQRRCLVTSTTTERPDPVLGSAQHFTPIESVSKEKNVFTSPSVGARFPTTDHKVTPTKLRRPQTEYTSEARSGRPLPSVAGNDRNRVEVTAGVPLAGISSPVASDSTTSDLSNKDRQETRVSREVNRLARKIRRMEQGKWKHQSNKPLSEAVQTEELPPPRSARQGLNKEEEMVRSILEESTGKHVSQKRKSESVRLEYPRRIKADAAPKSKSSSVRSDTKAAARVLQKSWGPSTDAPSRKDEREAWQIQKAALEAKFGEEGWKPRKRLSPDSLNGIRALHESDPQTYTTAVLADHLKVTPEAIRRILKSKWRPKAEEIEERRVRWEKRGVEKRKAIRAQDRRSRKAKKHRALVSSAGPGSREIEEFGRSNTRHLTERLV